MATSESVSDGGSNRANPQKLRNARFGEPRIAEGADLIGFLVTIVKTTVFARKMRL